MIINQANIAVLTTGYKAAFQKAFSGVAPMWERVATMVPSTTDTNLYAWLGQFPQLREWLADRAIQNLRADGYSLKNKKFESTIAVKRTDIEDDQWGIYSPLMAEMGSAAATHPDTEIFAALLAGFNTKCFDGQYFFDVDHPVGMPGSEVTVSNFGGGDGPAWFLLDTSRSLKPLLYQKRQDYRFIAKQNANDSDHVFMRDEFLYGVDGRMAAGYGFWQMAYGSRQPITADSVEAAYTSMTKLVSNEGRKLGIKPNIMLCGPSTYFQARALIEAQMINATSNTLFKLVEIVLVPWLE